MTGVTGETVEGTGAGGDAVTGDSVEGGGAAPIIVTNGALWDTGSAGPNGAFFDSDRGFIGVGSGIEGAKVSSFQPTAGKWYFEIEWVIPGGTGSTSVRQVGVGFENSILAAFPSGVYVSNSPSNQLGGTAYQANGTGAENLRTEGVSTVLNVNTVVDGSVIGIALDIDSANVYYSFDDVYLNGANPGTGANAETINGDTTGGVQIWGLIRDQFQGFRLRTNASEITGTPPSGYNVGWGPN